MSTTPQATVSKKKSLPLYWLVPIAAAALAGYMVYDSMSKRGVSITIDFEDASGVIAGKTELRYGGVKVGMVEKVTLSKDLKSVHVEALLSPNASNLAREGTAFWIVRPSLSLAGVSGVETLISGNYLELIAGNGPATREFKGLAAPPPADPNSPDLNLLLLSRDMPSVNPGSAVLFRGVKVGMVTDRRFDHNSLQSIVEIRIKEEFKDLVRKDSRFWNSSGLNLSLDLNSGSVKADHLITGLLGSINFNTTDGLMKSSPPAQWGDKFPLFPNFEEMVKRDQAIVEQALKEDNKVTTPVLLHIPDATGLSATQTEIRCRGIPLGKLISLDLDHQSLAVTGYCILDARWADLLRTNSRILLIHPEIRQEAFQRLKIGGALSGAHLEVIPGDGDLCREFTVQTYNRELYRPMDGLRLKLRAPRVGKLEPGSPVLYRGIPVGQIETLQLAGNGASVELGAVIERRYAPLVRANSRFWNSSGIDINFSLMKGLSVATESVDSVLAGAIAFATPGNNDMGPAARNGATFDVAAEPQPAWHQWQPVIDLGEPGK